MREVQEIFAQGQELRQREARELVCTNNFFTDSIRDSEEETLSKTEPGPTVASVFFLLFPFVTAAGRSQ